MKKIILYICIISFTLVACSEDNSGDVNDFDDYTVESNYKEKELNSVEITEFEKSYDSEHKQDTLKSSNSEIEADISETVNTPKVYSTEGKRAILEFFLDWASYRAEIGGMVVSDYYLGHGASGFGDWYANTVNGEIQIQDVGMGMPGYDYFDIHAIGGVVFYTSIEKLYGYDSRPINQIIAAGFSGLADPNMPVIRYLLGDDGIIYELSGNLNELGSFNGGYGLYDDNGTKAIDSSSYIFRVSEDKDAQEEYKEILSKFN